MFFVSVQRATSQGMLAQYLPRSALGSILITTRDRRVGERFAGRDFFFSSRRRHTRSVSAFLLNRSSDLLFHVLVGCGLLMLKVSRLKLPVIWLLVSMWLNTLTKSQIWTLLLKV